MKKVMRMVLALLVVLMASALPAHAMHGGHSGHGGGHVRFGVFVGPAWWGPGWWGYPYYPYYPPAVVQQQPEVYVQPTPQTEQPAYWYFCQDPEGYYPYVKRCPQGWMKVVPPANPPGEE